jgi:CRISPR/Cas system-associated protein Csm6
MRSVVSDSGEVSANAYDDGTSILDVLLMFSVTTAANVASYVICQYLQKKGYGVQTIDKVRIEGSSSCATEQDDFLFRGR